MRICVFNGTLKRQTQSIFYSQESLRVLSGLLFLHMTGLFQAMLMQCCYFCSHFPVLQSDGAPLQALTLLS